MTLEELYNEKLEAHSRENEHPDICLECDCEPGSCDRDQDECMQAAAEADAEERYEARREL